MNKNGMIYQKQIDEAGGSTKATTNSIRLLKERCLAAANNKCSTGRQDKIKEEKRANNYSDQDNMNIISGGGVGIDNEESMLELERKLEEFKSQTTSGRMSCPPTKQYKKLCLQGNYNNQEVHKHKEERKKRVNLNKKIRNNFES
eukprot:CAMPEP_0170552186 /NCGR_PEP_ID=MMETSP0211-20121228/10111_1 /TAXON_ID=311385 /ORGANISM="Pseudokeronopsis sp., Strain OXSARD2" /LENGTH=144 /DNA_ID=CAMNT_0010859759 /DNA_START=1567 /DNA_END=2001 /DNA_ORIENTATION=-